MDQLHSDDICLRNVQESDLPTFFQQQLDHQANTMAAFAAKDPTDREAFSAKWQKILADKAITLRTILYREQIAGHIVRHTWFGEPEVSYWLGKEFWGKGIATAALTQFLLIVPSRPLYARAVKDNIASLRVLEKSGFAICGQDKGFANARGQEVEELILTINI